MIAIRGAIPLAILLGFSLAFCQQGSTAAAVAPPAAAQPQPAQVKAQSSGVVVEEEEVMTEEVAPAKKDTAAAKPAAQPATAPQIPVQPQVNKSTPQPAAAPDTGLFIGEGEEDIFQAEKVTAPAANDAAAKPASTTTPANASPTSTPKYEDYDRGQRYRGRYSGGMPREEAPGQQARSSEAVKQTAATNVAPVETVKPAVIEQVRSINFAKNLKEYRSPKTAMFMSLLLPGLGQAYTKRYVKAGVFGAVEIALISASVKFAMDGTRKKKDAQAFADLHFDADTFRVFYNNLRTHITNTETKVLPPTGDVKGAVDEILSSYDTTEFFKGAASRSNDYYSSIASGAFTHG